MSVKIHPTAIVDEKAELGKNVEVGAFSVIGPDVKIGNNTKIHSHVLVDGIVEIGENNEFFQDLCGLMENEQFRRFFG